MVPAANRLRRGADFRAVMRSGRRSGGPRLVVSVAHSGGHDARPARVGFSVGRSVGNAVVRNAVRRRLRHLMRDRLGRLPAGTDVVVRALPGAATASSARLSEDLDRSLGRLVDHTGASV